MWRRPAFAITVAVVVIAAGIGAYLVLAGDGTGGGGGAEVLSFQGPIDLVSTVTSEPEEAWKNDDVADDDGYVTALAGDGSHVYVMGSGDDGPVVLAVDRSSGETVWDSELEGYTGTLAVVGSTVLAATTSDDEDDGGTVTGFSADDGEELWAEDVEGTVYSITPRGGDAIVQASTEDAYEWVAFDAVAGDQRWSEEADHAYFYGDRFYTLDGDELAAHSVSDGAELWKIDVDEESYQVAANSEVVVVGDGEKVVAVGTDGDDEELWDVDIDDSSNALLPVSSDTVAVTDGDRTTVYDEAGEEVWDARGSIALSRPSAGRSYVVDDEDMVSLAIDDGAEQGSARFFDDSDESYGLPDPWAANAFFAVESDELTAYDPDTLDELWSTDLDSYPSSFALLEGAIAYANEDGEVILLT